MILCIDVGNSNIKYAVFDGDALKVSFRVSTDLKRTSDEYGAQIVDMLSVNGISPSDVRGGIFSSVVPSLDYTIEHMLRVYFGIVPLQIAPGLKTGLKIRVDNAHEVVVHKDDRFVGTGHNALLQLDDAGQTWMLYHAFELSNLGAQRQVLLDRVLWDDAGWPVINGQQPSHEAEAPEIR